VGVVSSYIGSAELVQKVVTGLEAGGF